MATLKIKTHQNKKPTIAILGRDLPKNAKWVAQDANGDWFSHPVKPYYSKRSPQWYNRKLACKYICTMPINNDWKLRCYRLPANL